MSGFWRLRHDDLANLLARRDLNWEIVRVYLAVGDLTRGYGKVRDAVSLSQIADLAGMFTTAPDGTRQHDYRHVRRALLALEALGLYGQAPGEGQAVIRWVVWPTPPLSSPPTPASQGSSDTTALQGSSTTAETPALCGSGPPAKTTAKATAGSGSSTTASQGRDQEYKDTQDTQEREKTLDGDGLSPSPGAALHRLNGDGTATANGETAGIQGNGSDTADNRERLIALAFPAGASEKQRAALVTPLTIAERAGVPAPFVAAALVSSKAGLPAEPWKRVDDAIAKAQKIVEGFNYEECQERERAGTEPKPLIATLKDLVARGLAEQWPDEKRLRGGLTFWTWRSVKRQCTEWPDGRDDYGVGEKPASRYRASHKCQV